MAANLNGIDMFAKIQDFVAFALVGSLILMGLIGCFGLGTGTIVEQPAVLSTNPKDIISLCGLAFFLFIGSEFVIPLSNQVKNPRRNVPLGMILSLLLVFVMQSLVVTGFSRYTPWAQLAESATPHVLYGGLLLGKWGTAWMVAVSILAVTSTVNTVIASLSRIMQGMAKIGLLPAFFLKTNKKGAPYVGIIAVGVPILLIDITGLSTSSQLSFLILTGCVFWMLAYVTTHIDVLVLRRRLPKVPRTFKVPFGPLLPLLGMAGTIWMLYHIESDPAVRLRIYAVSLLIFAILAVYSVIWIKLVMKRPLFKPYAVKEVMAMENDLYRVFHRQDKSTTGKQLMKSAENGAQHPAGC